jgi:phage gp36-like protein
MSYCTQSDIEKLIPTLELAELTTESGSSPDAATVTEAIAKADAEIDSYLRAFFTVPLSPTSARVKSLSEDIAIYYLYMRRSTIPEPRQKAYDNAIAFLKLVAAGKASIPSTSVTASSGVQIESAAAIFERDNMNVW